MPASHGMNERADRLAAQGAQGMRTAAAAASTFRPTEAGKATGAEYTLRPAGRATSRSIRCRTEGRRGGREGGGEDATWYRVSGASGQTQIDHSDRPCPRRPQPSRGGAHLFSLCVVHTDECNGRDKGFNMKTVTIKYGDHQNSPQIICDS